MDAQHGGWMLLGLCSTEAQVGLVFRAYWTQHASVVNNQYRNSTTQVNVTKYQTDQYGQRMELQVHYISLCTNNWNAYEIIDTR